MNFDPKPESQTTNESNTQPESFDNIFEATFEN